MISLSPKRITLSLLVLYSFCVFVQTKESKGIRISAKKCQEYKEFYRETFAPRVKGRDPILGKLKCPSNRRVLQPNLRRDVFHHEFPHTASLWYETTDVNATVTGYKFRCSGVLISKRYVLTPAHCIYSRWGKPTHVMFGDSNLYVEQTNSKRQVIPVGDISIHPHYVPPSSVNDLALVHLSKGVKYDTKSKSPRPSVRPACLPQEEQEITSGISLSTFETSSAGALKTERVELFESNKLCEPFVRTNQQNNFTLRFGDALRPSQVCVKGMASSTCLSDLGGALTIQTMKSMPCVEMVIGIMSVNATSCSTGEANPIVFTKVENYLDWIEGVVWPKQFRRGGLLRTESAELAANNTSTSTER